MGGRVIEVIGQWLSMTGARGKSANPTQVSTVMEELKQEDARKVAEKSMRPRSQHTSIDRLDKVGAAKTPLNYSPII